MMAKSSRPHQWLLLLFIWSAPAFGQLNDVRAKIDSLALHARGLVGVAAIDLQNGDTLSVQGDSRSPMQSVYKFPLALAVLDRVDKGIITLDQTIHLSGEDLRPNTWSPLARRYPAGDINFPVDSLLKYTIVFSDNNGCDILFRLVGGTHVVDQFIHELGIPDISIIATEYQVHQRPEMASRNWSSPRAMARLLELFFKGKILSPRSREYLWRLMASSVTGPSRIKGLLPAGTPVPHKTGSSGTNERGIADATNDVGIITLPDGRHIALAVFVSDSDAPEDERDLIIAAIARTIWDGYSAE